MSRVSFSDVEKMYGTVRAVERVDLDIEDGEFVSLLGPSGSGKSTVLRMIAGLEDITSGEISIGDRVINDIHPRNRGIAMVFQNYALYPHMSVRDNLSYGLKLTSDLPKSTIDERVEDAAEMLGIEDHLDKKPAGLSGGQQQRVATGRAIVREPEVFLMDEPLSNLDAKLKMHMRTELQRIHDELGTTTVYVTHDQEEAMTMSDRIVILAEGVLQQVGTPDEIYNHPANLFVADFIGSPAMNFFDVRLNGSLLAGEGFEYQLSNATAETVRESTTTAELTLGIRPEDLDIVDSPSGQTIQATVDVVEPVGSDNYIYADVAGQELTIRVSADTKPEVGDAVSVQFDEDDIHLFDTETEQNVFAQAERATGKAAEQTS
ncbi:ABC transporter ATP-binding protein [Haloarcula onubensis]|uniref:Sn-glycerol-3-phosphate ABC transporter ATP-binding protein UgpC n=1 Tax=Haloarcula onubensis TaxID=2950539 RepID=A0ABU2FKF5_9EURY|nr:sn-glycerol-3-phosphate ABC transporter ATP-binding protein UgpC [Halomicroarcula sp. S3CR25-11]MDS0280686.1 sn-glycerol-3-phosphate ABC transporter ATP-binding protein UgpC [Halomicroarcula sp. S3CR25-11]